MSNETMTDIVAEACSLLRSAQSQIGSCRPPAVFDDMADERAAWDRIENCIARLRGEAAQGEQQAVANDARLQGSYCEHEPNENGLKWSFRIGDYKINGFDDGTVTMMDGARLALNVDPWTAAPAPVAGDAVATVELIQTFARAYKAAEPGAHLTVTGIDAGLTAALAQDRASQAGAAGGVVAEIELELQRAVAKFPTWPTDPLHASGVVMEESGELAKAVLQAVYEPHKSTQADVRAEAIQTAAMAIRFVQSLDAGAYSWTPGAQHSQSAAPTPAAEGEVRDEDGNAIDSRNAGEDYAALRTGGGE